MSRYATSKILGKLDAEIIPRNDRKGKKVYGVCCSYDTDVFIRYGSNQNWNIIVTTDFTMDIKRCFEIYQIRWNIEVLNKESKGYLGLGKYQGRDFDGQIADCTLCYMTYMVMALDKRLNDYETFGELFKEQRQDLMALTLWQRVLDIIRRIMNALAELIGISAEELVDNIIRDEKSLEKYYVMIDALEQLDKAA